MIGINQLRWSAAQPRVAQPIVRVRSVRYGDMFLVCALFAGLAACESREKNITAKARSDKTVAVSVDDPAMLQAFARARGTLDNFLARVAANDPLVLEPLVKVKVQDGDVVEYFWVDSPTEISGAYSGTVRNDPETVHNVTNGQTLSFPRTQIYDWMYTDANTGKLIGNYTACALLTHETAVSAAEFRKTYHLDCEP